MKPHADECYRRCRAVDRMVLLTRRTGRPRRGDVRVLDCRRHGVIRSAVWDPAIDDPSFDGGSPAEPRTAGARRLYP